MATWTTSGYRNSRGAEITFTYTAEYQASTNQTKVTASGYSVTWKTGGSSGTCEISGTFKVASVDTPASYRELTVLLSTSGNSPTKSAAWSSTFYLDHDDTEDKSIVLSFDGDVNAVSYKPGISDAEIVHLVGDHTMTSWVTSGYRNNRGAEITFIYEAKYLPASNKTKVLMTGYTVAYNTGGASGTCSITGTLTVTSADTPSCKQTFEVSQDYSGNSPTHETKWAYVVYLDHDTTEDKSIVLSLTADINANGYKPTVDDSITVHVATAQNGLVYIANGSKMETYEVWIANGTKFERYEPYIGNGSKWDPCR